MRAKSQTPNVARQKQKQTQTQTLNLAHLIQRIQPTPRVSNKRIRLIPRIPGQHGADHAPNPWRLFGIEDDVLQLARIPALDESPKRIDPLTQRNIISRLPVNTLASKLTHKRPNRKMR